MLNKSTKIYALAIFTFGLSTATNGGMFLLDANIVNSVHKFHIGMAQISLGCMICALGGWHFSRKSLVFSEGNRFATRFFSISAAIYILVSIVLIVDRYRLYIADLNFPSH